MKSCPQCNRVESDSSLAFCRVDGARLIAYAETSETPTAILTTDLSSPEVTTTRLQSTPSIAVLPFVNISADPENEYFCDGLAEELLNALAKIEDLKVAARTSAFAFKGQKTSITEIGRALGVGTVLEGSVRKSGNRLRITVQLINVTDGYHLWSERYDREMQDIFDVQDEITHEIFEVLRVRLSSEQRRRLAKRQTESADAYEAYLKGRYYWNKRTPDGLRKSKQHFQEAVDIDPAYALAYAGLADSHALPGIAEYGLLPPSEAMPRAKAAAEKALEIDPTLAEAQTTLAHIRAFYDWSFPQAEQEFQKAIKLDPNYAFSHHWYALFLAAMGRHAEALKEEMRAQEIEPLSLIISKNVGTILYYGGQLNESIEHYRKTLELEPNFARTHIYLGVAYERKGQFVEAIAEYHEALRIAGEGSVVNALLGHAHALSGNRAQAINIIEKLKAEAGQHYVPAFNIAIVYAGLGDNDLAFTWLDRAFEERSSWLVSLNIEPMLDGLRPDPRFSDLVKRVGL